MIVRVKLFAVARQRIGREEIEVELPGAFTGNASNAVGNALRGVPCSAGEPTIGQLRSAILEQHPALRDVLPSARLAVNNEYAADQQVLPPQAEIALIPPVSGG